MKRIIPILLFALTAFADNDQFSIRSLTYRTLDYQLFRLNDPTFSDDWWNAQTNLAQQNFVLRYSPNGSNAVTGQMMTNAAAYQAQLATNGLSGGGITLQQATNAAQGVLVFSNALWLPLHGTADASASGWPLTWDWTTSITGKPNFQTNGASILFTNGGGFTSWIGPFTGPWAGVSIYATSAIIDFSTNGAYLEQGTYSGSGAGLTGLNASSLATGTLPSDVFPATLPAVSGANITSLNASQLSSGTVPDARLSGNVPLLSSGVLRVSQLNVGTMLVTNPPALDLSASTNINASAIASGTVPDARLSGNVPIMTIGVLPVANGTNITGVVNTNNLGLYLVAGTGVTTITNSNGGLTVSSTGSSAQYFSMTGTNLVIGTNNVPPVNITAVSVPAGTWFINAQAHFGPANQAGYQCQLRFNPAVTNINGIVLIAANGQGSFPGPITDDNLNGTNTTYNSTTTGNKSLCMFNYIITATNSTSIELWFKQSVGNTTQYTTNLAGSFISVKSP